MHEGANLSGGNLDYSYVCNLEGNSADIIISVLLRYCS